MRKENIILGVIGFALVLGAWEHAFAALAPGEISMGVFSIPLPSNGIDGKDGCAPLIRSTEKDENNCYEIQQNVQTWDYDDKKCKPVMDGSNNQVWTKMTEICDGKDGENGAGGAVDVTKVYVPYPASTFNGTEPQNEGYIKVTIPAADDGEDDTILKYPDYCEEFYEDGLTKKKCTAQGDATGWANTSGVSPYQTGDSYIFSIDVVEDGYPRLEYVRPVLSSGTNGYPTEPGYTKNVTRYENGREQSDLVAIDSCDKYAKSTDTSDRVTKCTVGAPSDTPGATSPYAPGDIYCLGNHLSDCNQYTIPVGAVDVCAGLSSDDASRTARSTTTEYYGPTGNSSSTSRDVGYVATTQVMCSNDSDDDITATHNDPCTPASNPTVTCASGYTWQTCTNQTNTTQTYTGCFPSNLGQLFAYKDEIVQANFASDGNNLYYCQIQDCDSTPTCWIDGDKANGPNPNGELEGTNCWGVVSIDGLQGDAGPGCSFAYYNNQWQVCCLPVDASGSVNVNGSWSCKEVTDAGILNQLNNWMCKPTYTTKYINKKTDGTYEYKLTATNDRTEATVGIRTTITNCDGTFGGDVDVFDGETGNDYNPCDGLTAGSMAALTTVRNTTNVYVPHGNGSNGTTTGIGYYTETNVMCDTSGNKIVKKYDKCDPVSLASGASRTVGTTTCSGNQTLLMCTPQEEPITPYYVCSDAEVSGYPKEKYFAPTVLDGKITKEGYTAWMHKYTSNGDEIEGDLADKDECHTVYKLARTNTSVSTVTTTTQTTRKCNVQSYEYPSPSSPWTVNKEYCLNTDANGNCDGYSDNISDSETSTLKYHLPTMSATGSAMPIRAGYTYYEVKDGNNVTVREIIKEKDKCEEKILGRNASSNINNSAVVTQCTVVAPTGTPGLDSTYTAGVTYCLEYANGTCPSGLTDIGSAIDAAADAETDPCADVAPADKTKTVKSTTVEQTARSNSAPRTTTTTRTMCAGDPQVDINYEKCKPVIPTPVGKTCSNGVWMQCSGSASGEPDGYCETNAVITYVAPVVNDGIPGYLHTVITRNGQTTFVNDQGDKCEPVIGSVTTRASQSTTVYSGYKCTCGGVGGVCGQTGDMYYLGDIVGHESDATFKDLGQIYEQASESDPCTGLDSEDAAKTVKKTEYEYVAKSATGNNTGVGYVKKTKIMCDDTLTIPHKEEEILYDTCEAVKNDNTCLTIVGPNYQCYNQTKNVGDSERAYKTCNPNANVDSILVANKIDEKLNKDITFEVKQNSQDGNKDYITITGTNMTDKPVVALESLQGQSVFDIWKEEQTENTKCQALFDKNCSELTTSDMLLDLSAQGNWARSEYGKNSSLTHADLEADDFQESLKPCQNGITISSAGQDANGGNKYTMTCTE